MIHPARRIRRSFAPPKPKPPLHVEELTCHMPPAKRSLNMAAHKLPPR